MTVPRSKVAAYAEVASGAPGLGVYSDFLAFFFFEAPLLDADEEVA